MRYAFLFAKMLAAALLAGCASYQVGTPAPSEYARVFVQPVINDSTYPLLEASLTSAIRKEINRTGMLSSSGIRESDARLKVEILKLDREIAAVQSTDVGRGRKFELRLAVNCSLYDRRNDDVPLFENRSFEVAQDIFIDNDLMSVSGSSRPESNQINAEYQAGPEISLQIAQRVAELLVDAW